ncbi:MAG: hypothetical protein U7123_23365 [Potamolinea sp.]
MLIGTSFLDSLKKSTAFKAALQGVRPAVVGMITAAAFVVGKTTTPSLGFSSSFGSSA